MTVEIIVGDALLELRKRQSESAHCCVVSPPYWGLRDYGVPPSVWGGDEACEHEFADESIMRQVRKGAGLEELGRRYRGGGKKYAAPATFEIVRGSCVHCGAWRGAFGLEPTPDMFVDHLVQIFEEVRRVLRSDGTLWLNIGDSYASATEKGNSGYGTSTLTSGDPYQEEAPRPRGRPTAGATSWAGQRGAKTRATRDGTHAGKHGYVLSNRAQRGDGNDGVSFGPMEQPNRRPIAGLKPKDMVGIPWMAAFALRRAGWWLRQEIIWSKPNPMPESTTDRCTKAHESIFLLTKSEHYFYDDVAIAEPANYAPGSGWETEAKGTRGGKRGVAQERPIDPEQSFRAIKETRNKRSVWTADEEVLDCDMFGESIPEPARRLASHSRGTKKVSPKSAPNGSGVRANESFHASTGALVDTRNKRSVWTVATQAYPQAHFATFPPALIEPCVLAGTSARGCCPKCLAPWERISGKRDTGRTQKMPDGMATHAGGHNTVHRDGREKGAAGNPVLETITLGWWPTCSCQTLSGTLPAYPKKPGRVEVDHEATYQAKLRAWLAECDRVNDRRREMCDLFADLPTVPAVVLDPFGGAGTTGLVADRLQRDALLVELNPAYAEMARGRIDEDQGPLFARAAE